MSSPAIVHLQSFLVLGQIAECLIVVFNVAGLALVQFLEQQYFPSISLPQDTVRPPSLVSLRNGIFCLLRSVCVYRALDPGFCFGLGGAAGGGLLVIWSLGAGRDAMCVLRGGRGLPS